MDDASKIWMQSLKDIIQAYIDNFQKTVGFLLLASGWLVTSEPARSFLKSSSLTFFVVMFVLSLVLVIHIGASILFMNASQSKGTLLHNAGVPASYYDNLLIVPRIVWMNIGVNGLLFLTLMTLALAAKYGW